MISRHTGRRKTTITAFPGGNFGRHRTLASASDRSGSRPLLYRRFGVAIACDLLVAADTAKFSDTHGKWGMSPTWGMSQRLPRRVGLLAAKEMMFSGRVIGGEEAVAMGLANKCVAKMCCWRKPAMAQSFLANSWFTLRADKMLINGGLDNTLQEGLAWERANSPGRGPDMAKRLQAFDKK